MTYKQERNANMNKVILIGRLAKDVDAIHTGEATVARYTLAVDRRYKRDNEQTADFINCVAFNKSADFAEKYFRKGMKVAVEGRIQTGSYTNKDGQKVYTTDVIVESQEFCESKSSNEPQSAPSATFGNDFMRIPEDTLNDELPFM